MALLEPIRHTTGSNFNHPSSRGGWHSEIMIYLAGEYRLSFFNGARKRVLHENGATMKTNVTLKIEADLLRKARVLAAEEGTSISSLLAAQLEHVLHERKGYQQARRRAVSRLRTGFDLHWTPPRSRDELHER
jgi:hypothetical protein